MSSTTLADDDGYRITLHQVNDAPSDPLVITFGGQPSDIADSGFGTNFCLSRGWDTIFVAQRHGTLFQDLSTEAFLRAVSPVATGRDVVCYGSSRGAYAALYFGGGVDARIYAAAPMLPAWGPLSSSHRYADVVLRHDELINVPRSSHSPVVLFDPKRREDTLVVEEMVKPAYPDLRPIELPCLGHNVLSGLSDASLMKPVVIGLVERDEIIAFDPPGEGHAAWHMNRGAELLESDIDLAIREYRKSISIKPSKQAFSRLLLAMLRKGDRNGVQAEVDAAKESGHPAFELVPALVRRLSENGISV